MKYILLTIISFLSLNSVFSQSEEVSILADGDVNTSLNGSSAKGGLGIRYFTPINDFSAIISIDTKDGTSIESSSVSDFGSALLNPGKGLGSVQLYDFWKPTKDDRFNCGISGNLNIGTGKWKHTIDSTENSLFLVSGNISFRLAYNFVPPSNANKASVSGDLGLGFRGLTGNITDDKEFLSKTINTTKTWWYGTYIGLNLKVNQFNGYANFIYILNDKGIKNFTNGQLILGIQFQGDLWKVLN